MRIPTTPTHNNNQNFMSQSPHMQQQQQMVRPGMQPQSPNQINNKNLTSTRHSKTLDILVNKILIPLGNMVNLVLMEIKVLA